MIHYTIHTETEKLFLDLPAIQNRILVTTGYKVKKQLHSLMLPYGFKKTTDVKGKYTANYVVKNEEVILTAYPVNLVEEGHINRGRKVPAAKIFSQKLPPKAEKIAQSTLQSYINNISKGLNKK